MEMEEQCIWRGGKVEGIGGVEGKEAVVGTYCLRLNKKKRKELEPWKMSCGS